MPTATTCTEGFETFIAGLLSYLQRVMQANIKLQAQDGRQMPVYIIEAHGRQREVNVLRGRPNAVWKSPIPAAALLGSKYTYGKTGLDQLAREAQRRIIPSRSRPAAGVTGTKEHRDSLLSQTTLPVTSATSLNDTSET
jgi:hypothetical protein